MKKILVFIWLMVFHLSSFSQSKMDSIDIRLAECLRKPESLNTFATCDCIYEALDNWDKKLNQVYKLLASELDNSAREKLIATQRLWVSFKENEIALIDATISRKEGTMWRVVRAEKVTELTRQRTIQLENLLSTLEE